MFDWRRPKNLGLMAGKFAPCRRTPNCVSSQADPADKEHYIAPIPFKGDAIAAVRKAVESMPRSRIISADSHYLYAEFRSALLRYVDDVEFFVDGRATHVRSCSRLRRRDFGVNRKREEALRRLIEGRGCRVPLRREGDPRALGVAPRPARLRREPRARRGAAEAD